MHLQAHDDSAFGRTGSENRISRIVVGEWPHNMSVVCTEQGHRCAAKNELDSLNLICTHLRTAGGGGQANHGGVGNKRKTRPEEEGEGGT